MKRFAYNIISFSDLILIICFSFFKIMNITLIEFIIFIYYQVIKARSHG